MTLVVQSFGMEHEYKRAILAVISYYSCVRDREGAKTILYTDNPDYFRFFLKDFPVTYVLLTDEKIKTMRGEIDFLHRMKIAIIEEAFLLSRENLLYVDSDTFFISDPKPLIDKLSEKKSFMHMLEYRFDVLRESKLPAGKPFLDFFNLINTTTFSDSKGMPVSISVLQHSWNAGVMLLHSSHIRLLPDVYTLTDQFYPPTQNHASEQYAFSVVLQNETEIQPCYSICYHYWYRVKKKIMDHFLAEELNERWSHLTKEKKIRVVRKWISAFPVMLENHVWMLRDNAIQSFHENHIKAGYRFAFRALLKNPFNFTFIRDLLYHTRRLLINGQHN